jgi:hypothetical protein
MKKLIILFSLIFSFLFNTSLSAQNNTINENVRQYLKKQNSTLTFIENKGQFKDSEGNTRNDILYLAKANGMKIYFFQNKISYVFGINDEEKDVDEHSNGLPHMKLYRYDVEFLGSNAKVQAFNEIPGSTNYLGSGNPITDVKSFQKLTYSDLYDNIDLVFYNSEQGLKYDFIVKPGGDPNNIRMKYTGVDNIELADGQTIDISLPFGKIKETLPISYEKLKNPDNGSLTREVNCTFDIDDNVVSFDVGNYDNENWLIIDPVVHWYSYLEGASEDDIMGDNCFFGKWDLEGNEYAGWGMYVDPSNDDIYIVGSTLSDDIPACTTDIVPYWDIFLFKMGSDGNYSNTDVRIVLSGLEGKNDYGVDIVCDGTHVYVLGTTYSNYFGDNGWTNNNFQVNCVSCIDEMPAMIILKFDKNNLCAEPQATYYGGYWTDKGNRIELFDDDNIYDGGELVILGVTDSPDIYTRNAFQPICNFCQYSSNGDAFIACLSRDLQTVRWASFHGGMMHEQGLGLDVDNVNDIIYATGVTDSDDMPTTLDAIQSNLSTMTPPQEYPRDAFVLKINGNTGALVYSSYFGGEDEDYPQDIAYLGNGEFIIAGYTKSDISEGFPWSGLINPRLNNYDNGGTGDNGDGFIAQFITSSPTYIHQGSVYVGGSNIDRINDIEYNNAEDKYYISGFTKSSDFPIYCSQQVFLNNDNVEDHIDAFVGEFAELDDMISLSYFGSSGDDYGKGVGYFSGSDRFVLSGNTVSSFTTPHDEQTDHITLPTPLGDQNVFVTNFGAGNGWPTFFGGDLWDHCNDLYVDEDNYIYITGWSISYYFPTTPGVFQENKNEHDDVIIAKFNPQGNLIFATFLGDINPLDCGNAIIAQNSFSDIFIAGRLSSLFLTNYSYPPYISYDNTYNGNSDGFLMRLSPDGKDLRYFTFLGYGGGDEITGMDVYNNNVYVCGYTTYTYPAPNTFPLKEPVQQYYGGGTKDAFVASFDETGDLAWSTYLGGNGVDVATDIVYMPFRGVAVTGHTNSTDFPTTDFAFEQRTPLGQTDGFLTIYPTSLDSLDYSTYLGGSGIDTATCIGYMDAPTYPYPGVYVGGFSSTYTGAYYPPTEAPELNAIYPDEYFDSFLSRFFYSGYVWVNNLHHFSNSPDNDMTLGMTIDQDNDRVYTTGKAEGIGIANRGQQTIQGDYDGYIQNIDWDFAPEADRIGTYIGGTQYDECVGVGLLDNNTNMIGAINTQSTSIVGTTFDVYAQSNTNSGYEDIFLIKINEAMTSYLKPVEIEEQIVDDIQVEGNLNIKLYPNPASEELFIEFVCEEKGNLEIEITDITGIHIIKLNDNVDTGINNRILYINSLQSGVYFIKFNYNGKLSIAKFIKL